MKKKKKKWKLCLDCPEILVGFSQEQAVRLKLKAAAPLGFEAALLQCREVVIGYEAWPSGLARGLGLEMSCDFLRNGSVLWTCVGCSLGSGQVQPTGPEVRPGCPCEVSHRSGL